MNILVLNPGSTTLKFKLFSNNLEELISGGLYEEAEFLTVEYTKDGNSFEEKKELEKFKDSAKIVKDIIAGFEVDSIGFRVVHGGEIYKDVTKIDEEVISNLEELSELAPLHNPPAVGAIRSFKKFFPDSKQFAVFDTSFHNTIPEKAYLYGIPYKYYTEHKVRRYGFHGTSVEYVVEEIKKINPDLTKVIVCHLGGGASITAVNNGKSIDTTMGFTPLEGLIMATRSGDTDDGIAEYIMKKENIDLIEYDRILNKESGLKGVSEITSDMKKLLDLEKKGDEGARRAVELYIYKIQKYIGSFIASLNGIDCLVFTAGIGAGSFEIRKRIVDGIATFGLEVSDELNNGRYNVKENLKISKDDSKEIRVIPTNEELQIARKIRDVIM